MVSLVLYPEAECAQDRWKGGERRSAKPSGVLGWGLGSRSTRGYCLAITFP